MKRLVQLVLDLFEPATASPTTSAEAPTAAGEPHFVHPRANRKIVLSNTPVAYVMVRARRRTIGMLVRRGMPSLAYWNSSVIALESEARQMPASARPLAWLLA